MRLLITLFSPATGTLGGLTRGLAIATAARRRGDEVTFGASGKVAAVLIARGERVIELPATTVLGLPRPVSRTVERRLEKTAIPVRDGRAVGSIWLVFAVSGLARGAYLTELASAEIRAVDASHADAIFTDVDPAAFIASDVTGVPITSTYSSVLHHGAGSWPWRAMRTAIGRALRAHARDERDPDDLIFAPTVLKIVPSVPPLDDADPVRPDVRYVGHLLVDGQDAPGLDHDTRPLVLGYVGTGSVSLRQLRRVLPAVFPVTGRHICLLASSSATTAQHIGGVTLTSHVPFERLLSRADWVLCHGGQNTTIQALRAGVPLVLIPGPVFERRYNAQKVVAAHAGAMAERHEFDAGWLSRTLTNHDQLAAGARRLGTQIRAAGGADAAMDAIASHAKFPADAVV